MGLTVTVLLFAALALPLLWLMKQVYNAGMAVAQLCYNAWGRSSGQKKTVVGLGIPPMLTSRIKVQPSNISRIETTRNVPDDQQGLISECHQSGGEGSPPKTDNINDGLSVLATAARPAYGLRYSDGEGDPCASNLGEGDPRSLT